MKKISTRVLSTILALSLIMSVSVFASARASDQIGLHSITVYSNSGGQIGIYFTIEGTGKMTNIGAESITIYEKFGNLWLTVASYDRNDTGMSTSNAFEYGNTIYYNGTTGTEYKVVVTVFAENSAGYDSRSKTTTLTAK